MGATAEAVEVDRDKLMQFEHHFEQNFHVMRRAITAAAMCVIAIAVMPVAGARAAAMTIDVTSTTYDRSATVTTATADCTGPSSTKCTLEDALALANANPGSTINVEAGDFVVDGKLQITEPVTVVGQGASALGTAISQTPGDGDSALVVSSPGAVSLSGVEPAGGNPFSVTAAPGIGGGILIDPSEIGGTVSLDNDLITSNTATGADANVPTVTVTNGSAGEGGGIAVDTPGLATNLTLSGTIVSGNTALGGAGYNTPAGNGGNGGAGDGGGIYFDSSGTLSVGDRSNVEGNFATGGDGGTAPPITTPAGDTVGNGGGASGAGVDVVQSAHSVSITDGTVQGNIATGGTGANGGASVTQYYGLGGGANGGGVVAAAPLTITGTTIESNQTVGGSNGTGGNQAEGTAVSQGGGVDVADGATITQSLIAENVASGAADSGGALGGGVTIDAGATTIINTTLYGNEATSPSSNPGGAGGGLEISAATTLASDTIDANTAIGLPSGSNIATASGIATKFTDTIVADPNPMGPTGSTNCSGSFSDLTAPGGNLEDDSAGTCGFSHKDGDTVGSSSDLGSVSLALNRAAPGSPESLLPPPGSPELGTGGACIDPTDSPAVPLTVDQRGLQRPSGGPCDIGAVQIQAPANTAAPAITPQSARVGQQLTCGTGAWTADGTLAYAYAWLRGTTQVATGSTYRTQSADAGRSLTCAVTATSTYDDTGTATSAAVTPPAIPVTLGRVGQTHPKWREHGKAKKGRPPVGTAFRFTLSGAAAVRLTFSTIGRGVKVRGKCVARSRAHKGAKCPLTHAGGALTVAAKAGGNTVSFRGKVDGKSLAAGRWTVVISVAEPSGTRPATSTLSFTIDPALRKKPT